MAERYVRGYDGYAVSSAGSMAKTEIGVPIGVSVSDGGLIRLPDTHLTTLGDSRSEITPRYLLHMHSC